MRWSSAWVGVVFILASKALGVTGDESCTSLLQRSSGGETSLSLRPLETPGVGDVLAFWKLTTLPMGIFAREASDGYHPFYLARFFTTWTDDSHQRRRGSRETSPDTICVLAKPGADRTDPRTYRIILGGRTVAVKRVQIDATDVSFDLEVRPEDPPPGERVTGAGQGCLGLRLRHRYINAVHGALVRCAD